MNAAILLFAALQNYLIGQVESWERANQEQRLTTIQQIKSECKLPGDALVLLDDGSVVIQPASDTPYEAVECMLEKIKVQIGYSKIGFVGNERVEEEKK